MSSHDEVNTTDCEHESIRGSHAKAAPMLHAREEKPLSKGRHARHAAHAVSLDFCFDADSASSAASDADSEEEKPKWKLTPARIALIIIGLVLTVVIGCAAGAVAFMGYLTSTANSFESEEDKQALLDALAPTEIKQKEAVYVAVLGIDTESEDHSGKRADVVMVARVCQEDGTVTLVSIPRDTMVDIEGYGTQKINAAFTFGGAAGAVKCLSEFAGVPISHYVEIDFDRFKEAIDMLGGIDVQVPVAFQAYDGTWFEPGTQHLNGEQALAFVRDRKSNPNGDFGRAQAQRLVLSAVADKVLACSTTEIPGVVAQLATCVTTDYTAPDLAHLALMIKSTGLTMYTAVCPSYTLYQDGVSYVGTQYAEWQDLMRRVDAGLDPNNKDAVIPEPQASDTVLGSATNGASPSDYAGLVSDASMTTAGTE